ncbi:uncharacterized protein LOC144752809 [Lissotriton helveticus]
MYVRYDTGLARGFQSCWTGRTSREEEEEEGSGPKPGDSNITAHSAEERMAGPVTEEINTQQVNSSDQEQRSPNASSLAGGEKKQENASTSPTQHVPKTTPSDVSESKSTKQIYSSKELEGTHQNSIPRKRHPCKSPSLGSAVPTFPLSTPSWRNVFRRSKELPKAQRDSSLTSRQESE